METNIYWFEAKVVFISRKTIVKVYAGYVLLSKKSLVGRNFLIKWDQNNLRNKMSV